VHVVADEALPCEIHPAVPPSAPEETSMGNVCNIFACLVHESQECVIDLVRNLRALDPSSLVLLYDGGRDPKLLKNQFPFDRYNAVLHPLPRPTQWGQLHHFALDCMAWACKNHPFDTLTIVDSDQLLLRPGYSDRLAPRLEVLPRVGMLGNAQVVRARGTRIGPAEAALLEIDLWRPLLQQFRDGEARFVHWCFWPATVFTADASRDLIELFATNRRLQEIMRQTRIWATEEVILPTLVALLGYQVCDSLCSYDYVQFRVAFTLPQLRAAIERDDVFWIHPVPRHYEDPLRKHVRERCNHYQIAPGILKPPTALDHAPLLLTMPIIERMRGIQGWLEDAEADLLIAALARAVAFVRDASAVVEVGSYHGKSTVVLGSALRALADASRIKIYAIDPHDGVVGALDQGITRLSPSLGQFQRNIADAGLSDIVEPFVKRSSEVEWDKPICFLFIDGLHDYANVARDFYHFEPFLVHGGFVVFHDYASYYPGVRIFVDELLTTDSYEKVHQALSLIVLRKKTDLPPIVQADMRTLLAVRSSPSVISDRPLVSCIMPTADRRAFVPQSIHYFIRQDYANRELIVLDDGADRVADLVPSDPRIRYVRLDRKHTMGAKHNLAREMAGGEIIVHWDDDDWMADWRLSYQVESLLAQPRNTLSGLNRLFFYDPGAPRAWEYVHPENQRPWLAGGTFCYFREFCQWRRFPEMDEGADTVFVWGLQDANILQLTNQDFYVGLVHARNTSPKRTNGSGWHALPIERIHGLLKQDLSFYVGVSGK
jgi:Methyltransferase domain/Glycosyl transferase family 2